MKLILIPSFFIAFLNPSFSQTPLNFKSYAISLNVSKDQSIILTSKVGEVAIAKTIEDSWHRLDPSYENSPIVERACFFNKDTGLVYGFIHNKKGDKYDVIYRTTNGGNNWKEVDFGQDGWVDNASYLDNGEAWLSVSGSGIAYTSDFGSTWKKIKSPEVRQRFTAIYFNPLHQGIIGSLWNLLAYTNDNGASWKFIPTPLDQKKYIKTNISQRPEIGKVALFKDHILVIQEDLVFYSSLENINWIWLPDYSNFFTDPYNSALYFQTKKGKYVRSGEKFNPIFTSDAFETIYGAECKNGNLFIGNEEGIFVFGPDNKLKKYPFQNSGAFTNPKIIGYSSLGIFGISNNKLELQSQSDGFWKYQFTFPFDISQGNVSISDNNSIVYKKRDSVFYFSLSGELKKSTTVKELINNFYSSGIYKIKFFKGSRGCFHYFQDQLIYTNNDGVFNNPVRNDNGSRHHDLLTDYDTEIPSTNIDELIKELPFIFQYPLSMSMQDLGFTEKDFQKCKYDIDKFEQYVSTIDKKKKEKMQTDFYFNENNLNFNRLLMLVDSTKYIDTILLNSILINPEEIISTTTNFIGFTLVNNKNETLNFTNTSNGLEDLYIPWTIDLNGCRISTTRIEVNNFLEAVYPNFLYKINKVKILHAIVKKLY